LKSSATGEDRRWLTSGSSSTTQTPTSSRSGSGASLCTGETYKKVVKLTFARGASVADPEKLFNSSLEGNVRRAIDVHEGEELNEAAFKRLVLAAIAVNAAEAEQRVARKSKKRSS
jgi:hypothetical protein